MGPVFDASVDDSVYLLRVLRSLRVSTSASVSQQVPRGTVCCSTPQTENPWIWQTGGEMLLCLSCLLSSCSHPACVVKSGSLSISHIGPPAAGGPIAARLPSCIARAAAAQEMVVVSQGRKTRGGCPSRHAWAFGTITHRPVSTAHAGCPFPIQAGRCFSSKNGRGLPALPSLFQTCGATLLEQSPPLRQGWRPALPAVVWCGAKGIGRSLVPYPREELFSTPLGRVFNSEVLPIFGVLAVSHPTLVAHPHSGRCCRRCVSQRCLFCAALPGARGVCSPGLSSKTRLGLPVVA